MTRQEMFNWLRSDANEAEMMDMFDEWCDALFMEGELAGLKQATETIRRLDEN